MSLADEPGLVSPENNAIPAKLTALPGSLRFVPNELFRYWGYRIVTCIIPSSLHVVNTSKLLLGGIRCLTAEDFIAEGNRKLQQAYADGKRRSTHSQNRGGSFEDQAFEIGVFAQSLPAEIGKRFRKRKQFSITETVTGKYGPEMMRMLEYWADSESVLVCCGIDRICRNVPALKAWLASRPSGEPLKLLCLSHARPMTVAEIEEELRSTNQAEREQQRAQWRSAARREATGEYDHGGRLFGQDMKGQHSIILRNWIAGRTRKQILAILHAAFASGEIETEPMKKAGVNKVIQKYERLHGRG